MPISVLLVDDNALFREGIAQILERDGRFQVVGQASRGDDAVAAASELQPGLILMDLQMPGMSGIEAIRRMRKRDPTVPIGVLTMFETTDYVQESMAAGASGYLAKDATPAELCEAASALAAGTRNLVAVPDATAGPGPSSSAAFSSLSPREVEVLKALSGDGDNEEIARQLGISSRTLHNHITRLYGKLGIHDRAQAVIVAVREGLVDIGPMRRPRTE